MFLLIHESPIGLGHIRLALLRTEHEVLTNQREDSSSALKANSRRLFRVLLRIFIRSSSWGLPVPTHFEG